ncbi:tetratricopeptide repeat protein [Flavobacterium sp.]|uniref:tetratricopeptide repeat protein n=2 Tax=Flavobacterium sp. TaxID=239 RepID=UPI004047CBF2
MKVMILVLIMFTFSHLFSQNDSRKYYEESLALEKNKNYDESLMFINKALKIDKERDYLLQKVKLLYFKSEYRDAINVLESIVTSENKFDDITVTYFSDLADCIGNSEIATKVLLDYVNQNNSPEVLAFVAQRYFLMNQYDESIFYYRKLIEKNPNDIDAIVDLSRILFSYKSNEEAVKELMKGLEINKDNIKLLTFLASGYHNMKDYDKAINIENKIISLEFKPEHLAGRAMLYELQGNKNGAYQDYKKIIEVEKCNLEYYQKILQYEFENKMYKNVINNSYAIINCNKDYENYILDGLYTSLFFQNNFVEGNKYLEKKLKQNPKNFNPYYLKILYSLEKKEFNDILNYIDLAFKAEDIEENDKININLLKVGYYLLKEDYTALIEYWKSSQIKSLHNNLSFTIIQSTSDRTDIKTNYNKETGAINSCLMIPIEVIKLLKDKYGFEMNFEEF